MRGGDVSYILDRLKGVRPTANGHEALCPAHDDRHPSLSVSRGEDGRVLLHCHVGCPLDAICRAIGIKAGDLFPPKRTGRTLGRIVASYDYCDANGTLLFQVVRYEPKEFRQRRPDGKGGWLWKLGDTPRVLYRLPQLLAAPKDDWAFVVEGEKDVLSLGELSLVATCNPGGAGKWGKLSDDSALDGRRVVIIADKDATGRQHARDVAGRLHERVADLRVLELPGDAVKDATDWVEAGGTAKALLQIVEETPPYSPDGSSVESTHEPIVHMDPSRPTIHIDTEEHQVVSDTVQALASDPGVFQRGGVLVRVIRERLPNDGVRRRAGSAVIQLLPNANLRERLTRVACFTKPGKHGDEVPAHPAAWLVNAVEARGEWDQIRVLRGISDAPVLRPDGTIWQQPGYDAQTGVLFEPGSVAFPSVHPDASLEDAQAAIEVINEAIQDFPFESDAHRAAFYAGLLTPLARRAFEGPSPCFLVDANIRGAGKGLLIQVAGHIVLGNEVPVSSYSHDSEEMRKKITAIAIAGDQMILLDNIDGLFGNDALDRALTSTRWKDRILGRSEQVELPLTPTWFATGNNVQVAADTTRRIIHIRLDCPVECPEERAGFAHPHLLSWVDQNRGRLLCAALTILSAFLRKGNRIPDLKPFGSFEGWSAVVREAIVWAGLPDPCLTRTQLTEIADVVVDGLRQLLSALAAYGVGETGFVVANLLKALYPKQRDLAPQDSASDDLRAAIESFVGCPPDKTPTGRLFGNRLRKIRRRVIDGMCIDREETRDGQGVVWRLLRRTVKS